VSRYIHRNPLEIKEAAENARCVGCGKQLLQNRHLLTMDSDKLHHNSQAWAKKINATSLRLT